MHFKLQRTALLWVLLLERRACRALSFLAHREDAPLKIGEKYLQMG